MPRPEPVEGGRPETAILHYTVSPVVGGVEAVIQAHVETFAQAGYPVTVFAGRGEETALPPGARFVRIPELDSQHPRVTELSSHLEQGEVPPDFEDMVDHLIGVLRPRLSRFHTVIVHNVLTMHFNLPMTAALYRLLNAGQLGHCIAWCHDFTWTGRSVSKVHPGYPWDLLRTYRPDMTYVVVSERRQKILATLLGCAPEQIHVVYNGVKPEALLGLSPEGQALITRLELLDSDLVLLMPVRVTRAKNIEYALHVVGALKGRGCRAKLVLTGPPDPHNSDSLAYFEGLQALSKQLGVEADMRFVFESGPDPGQPFFIDERLVGDLYRVSDVMFMPSHREGFGMPVLEAGLVGLPVVSTDIPAAREIGGEDVTIFDAAMDPDQMAERLVMWAEGNPIHRMRHRVRQCYTWSAIFERDIKPLLDGEQKG
jgi:glycosyltransferase involved in cell wall biosynthesis